MTPMRFCSNARRLLVLFALASCQVWGSTDGNAVLSACASQTPPFVIMKDGVGSEGYSVELLQQIANTTGRKARIQELPWARCLRDVEAGRIDLAVDAYDDLTRRTKFAYSTAYYKLSPQVFYAPERAVKGLPATNPKELQELKGCGVYEYTYEHYGLSPQGMDLNAKTAKQMLRMLLAGRCDYAVEELEYIIGGRQTEADWPDESPLRSYRPDWAQAPALHFLIGKRHPQSQALNTQIDTQIQLLESSGWLKQLRQKYFGSNQTKAR